MSMLEHISWIGFTIKPILGMRSIVFLNDRNGGYAVQTLDVLLEEGIGGVESG